MIQIFLNPVGSQLRLVSLWYDQSPFFMNKSAPPFCLFRFSPIARGHARAYSMTQWWVNVINSSLYRILWAHELKWSIQQVEDVAEPAFGSGDGWQISCGFGQKVVLMGRNCHSLSSKKGSSSFSGFVEWFRLDGTYRPCQTLPRSAALCYNSMLS